MANYQELIGKYKKRRHDTTLDALSVGLSCADNVAVDLGLLEDTGILADTLDAVSGALPFAVIAVTEQMNVILKKKDQKSGIKDAAFRMAKSGAAMSVGAAAALMGGPIAALPAAIGTRVLMDKYKSRALTAVRVQKRTERLRALRHLHPPIITPLTQPELEDCAKQLIR